MDGFQILGFTFQIEVTNPDGTRYESTTNPLTLDFYLDASVLGGASPDELVMQRDGVVLESCVTTGNSVPCVVSIDWTDDTESAVRITVRTDHASAWNVAALDKAGITTEGIVVLIADATPNRGLFTSLATKLRKGHTSAFLHELDAQSGKAIPAPKASVIRALVTS